MEKNPSEFRKRKPILSWSQCKRLGGIVSILMNKEPIEEIVVHLKSLNMIVEHNNNLLVTESGVEEARRLLKITGISLEIKKKGF
tara:strand:- start:34 stop:288 length:255 start_codon:yes stop_codon:yes gene_type:complete